MIFVKNGTSNMLTEFPESFYVIKGLQFKAPNRFY